MSTACRSCRRTISGSLRWRRWWLARLGTRRPPSLKIPKTPLKKRSLRRAERKRESVDACGRSEAHYRIVGLFRLLVVVEEQREILATGAELREPGVVVRDTPQCYAGDDVPVAPK